MNTLKTFAQKFNNDWSMNFAGMMAYSLITTIFPILLAILTIASLILNLLSPATFHDVTNSIGNALPSQLQSVINVKTLLNQLVKITGPLAIVSLVGLIWAGSNLFTNMENAFSIVFRTGDRGFLPQKVMAVGMVIVLAILLPLSLAASSLVTAGSSAFKSILPPPLGIVLTFVGPLTSLAILWVLFLVIYIVVPNIKVPFRDAWRGAVAAAVLFAIFDTLFPLYFKFFLNGNSKYGATAAALLVAVVFLWFFALITMIGAQINAVAMGLRPTRFDLAKTLCQDYKEHTSTDDQSGPQHGARPAAQSGPAARRAPKGQRTSVAHLVAAPLHGVARLIALPLRAVALLGWLAARPFVRSGKAHNRAAVAYEPTDYSDRSGSAAT